MFLSRLLQGVVVAVLTVAALVGRPASSAAADWSKIRVGTEGAYAPFNYIDSAGQLRGLDIDIVQALCARIGKTDPDLRDKLNAALKQILADGTYEAISKKYFPFSIY